MRFYDRKKEQDVPEKVTTLNKELAKYNVRQIGLSMEDM